MKPEDQDPEQILAGGGPEQAFRDSGEYEWNGAQLEPFGFVRKTAALELGLRYGRLTEDDLRESPNPAFIRWKKATAKLAELRAQLARMTKARGKRRGGNESLARELEEAERVITETKDEPETLTNYDGLILDAAIVIWLCSQPDSVCARARRKPREYESQIDRWAEKAGIAGANMQAAITLFQKIMADVGESEGKPDIKGEEGSTAGN